MLIQDDMEENRDSELVELIVYTLQLRLKSLEAGDFCQCMGGHCPHAHNGS